MCVWRALFHDDPPTRIQLFKLLRHSVDVRSVDEEMGLPFALQLLDEIGHFFQNFATVTTTGKL